MSTDRRDIVDRIWERDPTLWTGADEANWRVRAARSVETLNGGDADRKTHQQSKTYLRSSCHRVSPDWSQGNLAIIQHRPSA